MLFSFANTKESNNITDMEVLVLKRGKHMHNTMLLYKSKPEDT